MMGQASEQAKIEARLRAVEDQLIHLKSLIVALGNKLDADAAPTPNTEAIQDWVTDYVSLRLQQLVPHTCEHPLEVEDSQGPYLEGTNVPCTEEVVHRVGRIPIPFVREMVVQRVAERAREEQISRVDVAFFETSATF